MSLLETVFRESAPDIVTAQKEGVKTLYLKNQSLDNRKVHIITDADSHIELPTHEQVALNNNPDVSLVTEDFYRELETCLAPNFIESDFDIILLNKTLEIELNRRNFDARSETMSRQILTTATGKKFEAYFDYFEPDYTAYQTILVEFNAQKVAAGRLAMGENTVFAKIDDVLEADKVNSYTFKDLDTKAMLLNGRYYLPLNVPNRNIRKTLQVVVDYDVEREDYQSNTKTLEIITSRNDIAPYTVINVPMFARSLSLQRSLNVSALTSKVYNSRRYVIVTHTAGDEAVEVYVRCTNKSGSVKSNLVSAAYGTYEDEDFIVERARLESTDGIFVLYRLRNTRLTLQYDLSLIAVEDFSINAVKLIDGEGIGARHESELGTVLSDDIPVYDININYYNTNTRSGAFAISEKPLMIGDCVSLNSQFFLTNTNTARLGEMISGGGWSGMDMKWYNRPFASFRTEEGRSKVTTADGVVRQLDDILREKPYGPITTIERVSGGVNIHRFDLSYSNESVGTDPMRGWLGSTFCALPEFMDTEAIYVIVPPRASYSGYYSYTWDVEMSDIFQLGPNDSLGAPVDIYKHIEVTAPIEVYLTDILVE